MRETERDFSFRSLFFPLTTLKGIFWIAAIGITVYSNGLFNNFVLDDALQIVDNTYIHSLGNFFTFFIGSTFYNGGAGNLAGIYYKPILTTLFSVIYTLFGAQPFAFHFFQLLLHIASACILFLIFKSFFKKSLAFFLSLIFLVHPINSEAVFYISALQEPLFFLCGSIALYLQVRVSPQKHPAYIPIALLLLLSLLSKETGIVFILISIIYALLYKRKFLLQLLTYETINIIIYIFLRIYAIGLLAQSTISPIGRLNFANRLINIPDIFFSYLKTFFCPLTLSSSYEWVYKQISLIHFYFPLFADLIFISLIFLTAILLYKKRQFKYFKLFIFFSAWFFIGMVIHFQIIPLDRKIAERWMYFPIVGLIGMAGAMVEVLLVNLKNIRIITIVLILIIVILSARTFMRSFDWRNDLTLGLHDIAVAKNAYDLENIISVGLTGEGKLQEAKYHAERSVALYPAVTNLTNLGAIYAILGDYKNAKSIYTEALKYDNYYLTYQNLGSLALVYGDIKENTAFLIRAVKKFPYNSKLWLCLAILEYRQNNTSAAKTAIGNAWHLLPDGTNTYLYNEMMNNRPINIKVN